MAPCVRVPAPGRELRHFLTKGSLVYVEGSLQTRKWQDQNGQDRYTTEIKAQRVQFLDRRSDGPRADMGGYEDDYGAPAPAPRAPRGGNMAAASARPRAVPRPSSATTIWVPPSPPKLPTWTKCPSRHGCRIWSIWRGVPHGERPAFFVSGDRQARTAPVPPFLPGSPAGGLSGVRGTGGADGHAKILVI